MNFSLAPLKNTIQYLNTPFAKEGIKSVVGCTTFVFGMLEIYDIYQIILGNNISQEAYSVSTWLDGAEKATMVFAKASIILSAFVSKPGVFIVSKFAGCFFESKQLERVFGPNTIFANNPMHPRHVISIIAFTLSTPLLFFSTLKRHQFSQSLQPQLCTADSKICLMNLFNIITSRPVLHILNQSMRSYFKLN